MKYMSIYSFFEDSHIRHIWLHSYISNIHNESCSQQHTQLRTKFIFVCCKFGVSKNREDIITVYSEDMTFFGCLRRTCFVRGSWASGARGGPLEWKNPRCTIFSNRQTENEHSNSIFYFSIYTSMPLNQVEESEWRFGVWECQVHMKSFVSCCCNKLRRSIINLCWRGQDNTLHVLWHARANCSRFC